MNYDELIIFNNQLNDDIPDINQLNQLNQLNDDIPDINQLNQLNQINQNDELEYDFFLNEYVPKNNNIKNSNNTNNLNNFNNNDNNDNNDNKENILNQMINIYKENYIENCEFDDIYFPFDMIPYKLIELDFIKELKITNTNLENITVLPKQLEKLIVNHTNLKSIDCINFPSTLTYIDFSNNKIECIKNLKNIQTLILKNNNLSNIDFIQNMTYLYKLDISRNELSIIDNIIDTIEILNISYNNIIEINKLPSNLVELIAHNNKIYKICEFPKKIIKIDFYNNNFKTFPDFTDSIKWVDLSQNDLTEFPKNFEHLEEFDITMNEKLDFDPLKEEWKLFLDCKNNPDKKFSFDQHNKYIISETEEDNEDNEDNEDENDQLNKLKYFDDYLNLPSYEESQNDYIWSYNLKNDIMQNEIKIDKTRYVKLKNTYTI
jgi:hypothetical protein